MNTENLLQQVFKSLEVLHYKINVLDSKIKYIYEATVGDKKDNAQFVFDTIYKQKIWGSGDDTIGSSGVGSDPIVLAGYINFLNEFIAEKSIKSISDVGCGDWQYMQHVDLSNIYIGAMMSHPLL